MNKTAEQFAKVTRTTSPQNHVGENFRYGCKPISNFDEYFGPKSLTAKVLGEKRTNEEIKHELSILFLQKSSNDRSKTPSTVADDVICKRLAELNTMLEN